jgi:hypothetical protein
MRRNFEQFIQAKQKQHGAKFDSSELARQFIPFYESGERIEVTFSYGEKKRGTIGVTTGWKPCFLLMLTKRSISSSYTLSAKDTPAKITPKKRAAKNQEETFRCNQCAALMINGVFCHETGCPNSRKRFVDGEWILFLECFECGSEVREGESCDCMTPSESESL